MTAVTAATLTRSAVDPTVRQRWRRDRLIAAAAAVLVIGSLAVALAGSGANHGDLDPRSFDKSGTHALAALLGDRGIHVVTQTDPASLQAATGSTLVVVHPERLSDTELSAVAATPADLVLVGAGSFSLSSLGLGVEPAGAGDNATRKPQCGLQVAATAGPVVLGGEGYRAQVGGAQGCYPLGDGWGLLTFRRGGRQVTLLADGTPLANDHLAKEGDAALALGVLGQHPDVVWLVPPAIAPQNGAGPRTRVSDLLPSRLKWAVLQLAVAVLILALWQGRRLGRLVPERLPVVVRQSETVLGRARLYRRSRSLDRAADALREGARSRLARRLGFGPGDHRAALVEAIARRVGRNAGEIDDVLYGATPADDRALVALAQALSTLEQEVLRP